MFKSVAKFVKEFAEVAPKFEWYFNEKKYVVRDVPVIIKEITGIKKDSEYKREYTPLTAFVECLSSRYFEMERFDMAADEIDMSPECASQIIDACDEWPDRLHGYVPKHYEQKLREDILKLCFAQ